MLFKRQHTAEDNLDGNAGHEKEKKKKKQNYQYPSSPRWKIPMLWSVCYICAASPPLRSFVEKDDLTTHLHNLKQIIPLTFSEGAPGAP